MMRAVLATVLLLAGVAYPFIVHANLQNGTARWVAMPLAVLWLARAAVDRKQTISGRLMPAIVVGFCAFISFADDTRWLRGYPVLINGTMLAIFAASLYRGTPIIERFARLRHPELPPHAIVYTRRATWVWTAFFAFNGLTSAALSLWAPWHWWTLYNGVISYVLIGLLMAGEWWIRPSPGKNSAFMSPRKAGVPFAEEAPFPPARAGEEMDRANVVAHGGH